MLIRQLLSISERSYFCNPLFKTHSFIFPCFLRNDSWSQETCNQYYVAVISYWKGDCWTGNIGMMLIQCGNEDVSIHQDICTWWQLPIQIQSKKHPFYEILSRGIVMNIISRSSGIKWFFSHIFMDTGNWFLFIFKSNCYSIHKIQPHISYLWTPIFNSMNTRNAIHLPNPFFIQANNTHTMLFWILCLCDKWSLTHKNYSLSVSCCGRYSQLRFRSCAASFHMSAHYSLSDNHCCSSWTQLCHWTPSFSWHTNDH